MVDDEKKDRKMEPENIKEILSVVSSEVPTLIKSVLASVFSEEAGRNMGKAAAAYYKQLKEGGLPEQVAVKMTEDYMKTFTSIGEMLRSSGMGRHGEKSSVDIGEEIEKRVRERLDKRVDRESGKGRESGEEEKE
ncbi:MAG TPA: hypothetical protein VMT42_01425 [candidate division Zixibacteria bacterium]|nr:hypothetical protein [candidate division Zixibacteria bacterium]